MLASKRFISLTSFIFVLFIWLCASMEVNASVNISLGAGGYTDEMGSYVSYSYSADFSPGEHEYGGSINVSVNIPGASGNSGSGTFYSEPNATWVLSVNVDYGYYYTDDWENYEWRSESSSSTVTVTTPPTPSSFNFMVSSANYHQVNLSWTDFSTAQSYSVERSTDGENFTTLADNLHTSSYQDNAVEIDHTYYYRLVAYFDNSVGGPADPVSVTTNLDLFDPTNLTATAISSSRIDLAWVDHSTCEDDFLIEHSTDGINFIQIAVVPANTTHFQDTTSLNSSTSYTYRVRTRAGVYYSNYTNPPASATTLGGSGIIDCL